MGEEITYPNTLFWQGAFEWLEENVFSHIDKLTEGTDNIDEAVFNASIEAIRDGLLKWGVPDSQVTAIVDMYKSYTPDMPVLRSAIMGMHMAGLGAAGVKELLGVSMMGQRKAFLAELRPEVGSIGDYIRSQWIAGKAVDEDLFTGELGLPLRWLQLIEMGNRPLLGPEEIRELWRRNRIGDGELKTWFKKLGYSEETGLNFQVDLSHPLLDWNTSLQVFLRDVGLGNELDERLTVLGYDQKAREALKSLLDPVLTVDDLAQLRNWGNFSDEEITARLVARGWKQEKASQVAFSTHNPIPYQIATQAYWRGFLTEGEYKAELKKTGLKDEATDIVEKASWLLPSATDLIRFGLREVFTPDIAERFGQFQQYPAGLTTAGEKIGLKEDVLKQYWAAHWILPAPGQMFEMYHRGFIARDDLLRGLKANDYMPFWQDKMEMLSFRVLPRRSIAKLVRQNLLDFGDTIKAYRNLGYSQEDAIRYTQSAFFDIGSIAKTLTKAELLRAFLRDDYTEEETREGLQFLNFADTAIEFYIAETLRKKALEKEIAEGTADLDATQEAKTLTRSEIIRGYQDGFLTEDETREALRGLKYSDTAVEYVIQHADFQTSNRLLTARLRQVKKLYEADLLTETEVGQHLSNAGMDASKIQPTIGEWAFEKNAKAELEGIRDRLPSLADARDWLVKGVIETQTWADYMAQHGYADREITHYLLEIMIDYGQP
tara:strand:+ start:3751 stop:5901 length:2151 start_codon:yes stop_codon:yes gene_type:complete